MDLKDHIFCDFSVHDDYQSGDREDICDFCSNEGFSDSFTKLGFRTVTETLKRFLLLDLKPTLIHRLLFLTPDIDTGKFIFFNIIILTL